MKLSSIQLVLFFSERFVAETVVFAIVIVAIYYYPELRQLADKYIWQRIKNCRAKSEKEKKRWFSKFLPWLRRKMGRNKGEHSLPAPEIASTVDENIPYSNPFASKSSIAMKTDDFKSLMENYGIERKNTRGTGTDTDTLPEYQP